MGYPCNVYFPLCSPSTYEGATSFDDCKAACSKGAVRRNSLDDFMRASGFHNQIGGVSGCTCPCASNYDPLATTNDDSCVYDTAPVFGSVGIGSKKPYPIGTTVPRPRPSYGFSGRMRNQSGGKPMTQMPVCQMLGANIDWADPSNHQWYSYLAQGLAEQTGCAVCICDNRNQIHRFGQYQGGQIGTAGSVDCSACRNTPRPGSGGNS